MVHGRAGAGWDPARRGAQLSSHVGAPLGSCLSRGAADPGAHSTGSVFQLSRLFSSLVVTSPVLATQSGWSPSCVLTFAADQSRLFRREPPRMG